MCIITCLKTKAGYSKVLYPSKVWGHLEMFLKERQIFAIKRISIDHKYTLNIVNRVFFLIHYLLRCTDDSICQAQWGQHDDVGLFWWQYSGRFVQGKGDLKEVKAIITFCNTT